MPMFNTIRGLSELIFGSMGILSHSVSDLMLDNYSRGLSIAIQEPDGTLSRQPVFMTQTSDQSGSCSVIITVPKNNKEKTILVAKCNGSIIGIKFNWDDENDCGSYYKWYDEKWIQTSMLDKLLIATIFQNISQNDYLWEPLKENKELFDHLVSLVEDDSELDKPE